jgi:long-chain acyl-CoA synthetase
MEPLENLVQALSQWEERDPSKALFTEGGRDLSAKETGERVRALGAAMVAAGVEEGDRVALLARTRLEWTLVDLATLSAGAAVVAIYESSSASQVAWILEDSAPSLVVVETEEHRAKVRESNPDVLVWVIDDGDLERVSSSADAGARAELARRTSALGPDTLATLIYTSGTTGKPKGCMLTHSNLVSVVESGPVAMPEVMNPQGRTVMFLPLAHCFARAVVFMGIGAGVRTTHCPDPKDMVKSVGAAHPTFLVAVPRVLEKVLGSARAKANGGLKKGIFEKAYANAVARGGGDVSALASASAKVYDKLVYSKLRATLGGSLAHVISGGAPLDAETANFFSGAGIEVLEGYGLTETSAPVTVTRAKERVVGSVGRVLDCAQVRISADGEVEVDGESVFKGYWNGELRSGWWATGDLGTLTDGVLTITGRKKEMLVTAGGKNVMPGPLEEVIRANPLVSQVMVLGDKRPFVSALVTLDEEALAHWAKAHGTTPEEARASSSVRAEVEGAVVRANKSVSSAEGIKKFEVLEDDFTEENGLLTPTLKVKRNVVLERFAEAVEGLYAR